jgi:hypothetical protein
MPSTQHASDYDDFQQAAYWRQTEPVLQRITTTERLLRAAQAEVERLRQVDHHNPHVRISAHTINMGTFSAPHGFLEEILGELRSIHERLSVMSADLTVLTAEVENIETVGDSIISLLNGIAEQLRAAQADPAAISALANRLTAQAKEIADAVAANTPAEEPAA